MNTVSAGTMDAQKVFDKKVKIVILPPSVHKIDSPYWDLYEFRQDRDEEKKEGFDSSWYLLLQIR